MKRKLESILVTGGAGFIGSCFIRTLLEEKGFTGSLVNVDALTYAGNLENLKSCENKVNYHFVHGDICDENLIHRLCKQYEIDCIVHFAAETHVDRSIVGPLSFAKSNILGTLSLLEVVRKLPRIHLHHISTDEVYGSLGGEGKFKENSPYDPRSPYSASKAASDHFVRAYANTYGLSTSISNCSNNYGPCQFPEKLIPLCILRCLKNKSIPVYGRGDNVRDWLYVDDHAEGIYQILKYGKSGHTYNIGGNCEKTNLELIDLLLRIFSEEKQVSYEELSARITFVPDRPGHDLRYAIDSKKMQTSLSWSAQTKLEEGLRRTIRWYLQHPEWIENILSGEYQTWIKRQYAKSSLN